MFGFEFEQNLQDVRLSTSFRNFCLRTSFTQTSRHFFFKYPIKKYVPLAYILSESIERISNFDETLLKFLKFQMYFPIQWRVV